MPKITNEETKTNGSGGEEAPAVLLDETPAFLTPQEAAAVEQHLVNFMNAGINADPRLTAQILYALNILQAAQKRAS